MGSLASSESVSDKEPTSYWVDVNHNYVICQLQVGQPPGFSFSIIISALRPRQHTYSSILLMDDGQEIFQTSIRLDHLSLIDSMEQ
jgi:hypothetical protein